MQSSHNKVSKRWSFLCCQNVRRPRVWCITRFIYSTGSQQGQSKHKDRRRISSWFFCVNNYSPASRGARSALCVYVYVHSTVLFAANKQKYINESTITCRTNGIDCCCCCCCYTAICSIECNIKVRVTFGSGLNDAKIINEQTRMPLQPQTYIFFGEGGAYWINRHCTRKYVIISSYEDTNNRYFRRVVLFLHDMSADRVSRKGRQAIHGDMLGLANETV